MGLQIKDEHLVVSKGNDVIPISGIMQMISAARLGEAFRSTQENMFKRNMMRLIEFRTAIEGIVFSAHSQPRSVENYEKFLAALGEVLRKEKMGEPLLRPQKDTGLRVDAVERPKELPEDSGGS